MIVNCHEHHCGDVLQELQVKLRIKDELLQRLLRAVDAAVFDLTHGMTSELCSPAGCCTSENAAELCQLRERLRAAAVLVRK